MKLRKLGLSLISWVKAPVGLIVCAVVVSIVAIWVWPKLAVPTIRPGESRHLYLLSAAAQSAAAILAIVFTMTLIAGQLLSRYAHGMAARFFDGFTLAYITAFIIAVLFPLFIVTTYNEDLVKLAFTLVCIVLLCLVPFLVRFRDKLSLDDWIRTLRKDAEEGWLASATPNEPQETKILSSTFMSALTQNDYDTAGQCYSALIELAALGEKRALPRNALVENVRTCAATASGDAIAHLTIVQSTRTLLPRLLEQECNGTWRVAKSILEEAVARVDQPAVALSAAIAFKEEARASALAGPDYLVTKRLGPLARAAANAGQMRTAEELLAALGTVGATVASLPDELRGPYRGRGNIYYPRPDPIDTDIESVVEELRKVGETAIANHSGQLVDAVLSEMRKIDFLASIVPDEGLGDDEEPTNQEAQPRLAPQEDLREYYVPILTRAYGKVALAAARANLGNLGVALEWYPGGGCDYSKGDGATDVKVEEIGALAKHLPEPTVYFLETCLRALRNPNSGDLSWAFERLSDITWIVTEGNLEDLQRAVAVLKLVATRECEPGGGSEAVDGLVKGGLKAIEVGKDEHLAVVVDALAAISPQGCGQAIQRELVDVVQGAEEILSEREEDHDDPEEQLYSDDEEAEARGTLDAISRIRSELSRRLVGRRVDDST